MNYKFKKNPLLEITLENRRVYMNKLIVDDIKKKSKPNTPLKDGQLTDNVITTSLSSSGGKIVWDVPYASYQERGMRKDGTRIIKNYTTPGTGPWFAKNAVKKALKNIDYYFTKSIKDIK